LVTTHLLSRIFKGTRFKRRVIFFTVAAASLLTIIGYALSHEKATECGLVWLFEQSVGLVKRDVFGGSEE
jgi:hypothetical protein